MGFKYDLMTAKSHKDKQPHAFLLRIAGQGPTAYRYRAADLGPIPLAENEAHVRLSELYSIVRRMNDELDTFKSHYEGKRIVTGKKIYPSIIASSILQNMIASFTAFDIILSDDSIVMLMLLVQQRLFCIEGNLSQVFHSIFIPYPFKIEDMERTRTELIINLHSILVVLDIYCRLELDSDLIEIAYGRKIEDKDKQIAYGLLFENSTLTGWNSYNGMPFLTYEPEYGDDSGIESLIHIISSIIIACISKKSGLKTAQIIKVMSHEGRRLIYDNTVSFSPDSNTRNLSRIMTKYNLIPDKYERLEDSYKTMSILISFL